VIERGRRVRLLAASRELWSYRAISLAFTERNIRVKYKPAALGIAWGGDAAARVDGDLHAHDRASCRCLRRRGRPCGVHALGAGPVDVLSSGVSFGATAFITDGALIRRRISHGRSRSSDRSVRLWSTSSSRGSVLHHRPHPRGTRECVWCLITPVLAIPLALLAAGVSISFGAIFASAAVALRVGMVGGQRLKPSHAGT
jgi:hypothetical protein